MSVDGGVFASMYGDCMVRRTNGSALREVGETRQNVSWPLHYLLFGRNVNDDDNTAGWGYVMVR